MKLLRQLGILLLLVPSTNLFASADVSRSWDFSVSLDGKPIGYHRFDLVEDGERLEVRSEASFDVRFLVFTAFQYRHTNVERWDGECLSSIESSTRQNKKSFLVSGEQVGDRFRVETNREADTLRDCVMSFAYWNPEFLEQTQLLNPQDGRYLSVEVEAIGSQPFVVRGEEVEATAFRLKAHKMELTVWYSDDDEWLGLESVAKGGRIIRYELT